MRRIQYAFRTNRRNLIVNVVKKVAIGCGAGHRSEWAVGIQFGRFSAYDGAEVSKK